MGGERWWIRSHLYINVKPKRLFLHAKVERQTGGGAGKAGVSFFFFLIPGSVLDLFFFSFFFPCLLFGFPLVSFFCFCLDFFNLLIDFPSAEYPFLFLLLDQRESFLLLAQATWYVCYAGALF